METLHIQVLRRYGIQLNLLPPITSKVIHIQSLGDFPPITHIEAICHFVSSSIHQYANMMTSFYKMSFKKGKLADLVGWHSI